VQLTTVGLQDRPSHVDFSVLTNRAQLSEATLLEEAKAGNGEAFASLVSNCQRSVYQTTLRMTRNHEDAEDARQEAMLKAYANLHRFQGRSRFSTWLMRIAMNEALMKLRKRNTRQISLEEAVEDRDLRLLTMEIPDTTEHPEKLYARKEMLKTLVEAIESLRPRARDVFVLREMEQLSTIETAKALGISINSVKTRLRRARRELRDRLGDVFGPGLSDAGAAAECAGD
jgi:RNA polymerase sigma-70 factor (ECF subfamily)